MSPTAPPWVGAIPSKVAAGIRGHRGLALAGLTVALLALVVAGIAFGLNWGDIPTWVLAGGAIVTAYYARKAFREQSKEMRLLKEQVKDQQCEREREAAERRRAQAVKVFVAVGGLTPDMAELVRICNSSDQPIYDLAASRADNAELQRLPHLMPGDVYPFHAAAPVDATVSPVVWLDFRDAAGLHWRTTSRGELTGPRG
jgi:hypothetical protein